MQRNENKGDGQPNFAARPCPICGRPSVFAERPFCSKRCADIDLHRWLSGVYVVPAQGAGADVDEGTPGDEAGAERAKGQTKS